MMTKEKIADALEEISILLELKDENPFKIRAYQNAARSIEAFGASFCDLQNQETLEKIPGVGKAIAAKISDLAAHPDASQVSIAGSFRRRKEIVRDLDFIVASKSPDAITEFFCAHPLVESLIARGPTKTSMRLKSGIQCDLRAISNAEYPFALNYFTGSKEHNIVMRNRALHRGWTLNEYRLGPAPPNLEKRRGDSPESPGGKRAAKRNAGGLRSIAPTIPKINDETELYRALGLDFIPPELRENCGEFEAAENGKLPRLIELENLRGTFHCHTSASDGHNSLEEI